MGEVPVWRLFLLCSITNHVFDHRQSRDGRQWMGMGGDPSMGLVQSLMVLVIEVLVMGPFIGDQVFREEGGEMGLGFCTSGF